MPYKDKITCIYAILHPDYGRIMYIGQTVNYFHRMRDHFSKNVRNRLKKGSKLYSWINKLYSENKKPTSIILEMVNDVKDLDDREIWWISKINPPKNIKAGGHKARFIIKKEEQYYYDLDKIKEMIASGATIKDLSVFVGCEKTAIRKYLKRNGLKTLNSLNCNPDGSFKQIKSRQVISKEELVDMYCGQLLTTTEIAQIKGCSSMAIKAWLKKHDIPRRTQSESMKIRYSRGLLAGFRKHL